jgi:hypothetical protein
MYSAKALYPFIFMGVFSMQGFQKFLEQSVSTDIIVHKTWAYINGTITY